MRPVLFPATRLRCPGSMDPSCKQVCSPALVHNLRSQLIGLRKSDAQIIFWTSIDLRAVGHDCRCCIEQCRGTGRNSLSSKEIPDDAGVESGVAAAQIVQINRVDAQFTSRIEGAFLHLALVYLPYGNRTCRGHLVKAFNRGVDHALLAA